MSESVPARGDEEDPGLSTRERRRELAYEIAILAIRLLQALAGG